eukprot:SAG11_NODE_170_length_13624_cov_40.078226_8_plen_350_part_00
MRYGGVPPTIAFTLVQVGDLTFCAIRRRKEEEAAEEAAGQPHTPTPPRTPTPTLAPPCTPPASPLHLPKPPAAKLDAAATTNFARTLLAEAAQERSVAVAAVTSEEKRQRLLAQERMAAARGDAQRRMRVAFAAIKLQAAIRGWVARRRYFRLQSIPAGTREMELQKQPQNQLKQHDCDPEPTPELEPAPMSVPEVKPAAQAVAKKIVDPVPSHFNGLLSGRDEHEEECVEAQEEEDEEVPFPSEAETPRPPAKASDISEQSEQRRSGSAISAAPLLPRPPRQRSGPLPAHATGRPLRQLSAPTEQAPVACKPLPPPSRMLPQTQTRTPPEVPSRFSFFSLFWSTVMPC